MAIMRGFKVRLSMDLDAPPIPSSKLAHSYQVHLEPVEERYIKGVIEKACKVANGQRPDSIHPRRIPAYWYAGAKESKHQQLAALSGTDDDLVMLYFVSSRLRMDVRGTSFS